MKTLILVLFSNLYIYTTVHASTCNEMRLSGSYESDMSFVDLEYARNMDITSVVSKFNYSLYDFSLMPQADGSFTFRFDGLTKAGEQLLTASGATDKEDFLNQVKDYANQNLFINESNNACELVSANGDIFATIDIASGILYNSSKSNEDGKIYFDDILKRLPEIPTDADPFGK